MGQKSFKFEFQNLQGETLSGKLELPTSKHPKAYALFAHCFTCSKNIGAATRISRSLTQAGVAVLRFDFTGIGNSEGDFENTDFSSNIDDLISAARALEKKYYGPSILIGHSLGGAAVLKAGRQISSVNAIVTLGAPSDPKHVSKLFSEKLDTINNDGEAEVNLAGRKFTISKKFLEDIKEANLLESVKNLKKALLIIHSPIDETVSIDHAAQIYQSAMHPKSFISLDGADHLLSNKEDSEFVAQMIGAWSRRYLTQASEETPSVNDGEILVQSRKGEKFTQDIFNRNHALVADEPTSIKGSDLGMNPYELLLSALGACTSMTIKMYADLKKIPLDDVQVKLFHEKIHSDDCQDCQDCQETNSKKIDKIQKEIVVTGDLSEDEKKKLHEIAEKCPVNKTLKSEIIIENK